MALFDPTTGEYNEGSFALDTTGAVQGDTSIFESAANIVTKGVPLTGIAIVNSFVNTGIDIANFFGADTKRLQVEDWVGEGDMNEYYKMHEQGIEAAGLIVGSLAPGMGAIKALKLMQAGKLTAPLQRATNIFAGPKERIIKNALQEINAGDAALYGSLNADKFKAIALGFGDQALQALAYETATVATMKASPLLDQDGMTDVVQNVFFGALVGGGIGGVVEGIWSRSLINKALVNADSATKAQELATYLGRGGYFPGDRVAELLRSVDEIPEATNLLGRKKASATRDNAILESKKILGTMVEKGDEAVTNSLMDTILKMRSEQQMSKDEMYDYLARLSKVSRITDEASAPVDSSVFYINRFAKGSDAPTFEKLVSTTPVEGSDFSLSYRMRPFATETKVARFDAIVEGEGGKSVPRYNTAKEAFEDGNDLFIGKNGQIYVNEDAPNIERIARPGESRPLTVKEEKLYRTTGKLPEGAKPLTGAQIILNTLDGSVTDAATPVVGDFGRVEIVSNGLKYGDNVSVQDLTTPFNAGTETIDANARYAWAATRGIKKGDTIAATDIPMLEALYGNFQKSGKSYDAWLQDMAKQKVSIAGAEMLPGSPDELLVAIRQQKDNLIGELLTGSDKLGADEVALHANVPKTYLENALKATDPKDFMLDSSLHSQVNHVRMEYDIGNIYQQDGMILRGEIDVNYRIGLIKNVLKSAVAKQFGGKYEDFLARFGTGDATISGVGPKLFSFSNANYGTLGQEMERIGRAVTQWNTERMAAVSQTLSSSVNAIRNDAAAAAELGMFRAVRQRTGEDFVILPKEIAAKTFKPGQLTENGEVAVLAKSLQKDKAGNIVGWDDAYVPPGFVNTDVAMKQLEAGATEAVDKGLRPFYMLSEKVAAFERANLQVNTYRMTARNNWYTAQGLPRYMEPGALYTPPIDTTKYPHFALVKQRAGTGMGDDGVAVITAETAADLEQKIASLRDEFSVYTKDQLKKYHEVLGDYEYNRNFAQSAVNSALSRKGILNNVFPDTRAETIVKDYIDWHTKQELRLTRDFVELGNAQLFAELRALGERFTASETSKTGFVAAAFGRTAPNPYNDFIKTSLAITEKENYRLWADANEKLEATFSSAFRAAKGSFIAANKGLISYEEASKMAEKFGLGNPYSAATDSLKAYYEVANKLPPDRILSKFVSTSNSVLAATNIRLDWFQSFINTISTPVLMLAEANSAKGFVKDLMTTTLPDGTGRQIPASSKLMYNAVSNWFNQDIRAKWMPLYKDLQVVRDKSSDYFNMINELTLPYGKFSESEAIAKLKRGVDLGAKLTGSELSEEFGRFIAADTARQLFESAGYTGRQLSDNIITFVNRVHGNHVASQRPIAFQGPIGQAIGLFQTYQFNLMQQLFRYVENGEAKSLAILAGMQTTLFGLQGLPGFAAINNHIVGNAAGNPAHKDIYGGVTSYAGKEIGDYLLYGVTSNWLNTGLYSRGDINPRQLTILPLNPLQFPAVAGGIRFVGNLLDTSAKIAKGADLGPTMMLGLEHNGLSRPLMGLAQLAQGYTTTAKGELISTVRNGMGDNTAGLSDLVSIANFSRLLGARPLDEAIAMDLNYRKTLYQAKDTARITALGEIVKTELRGNGSLSSDQVNDFATKYAASGGNIRSYSSQLTKWTTQANSSIANKVFRNLADPLNRQMQMQMGGIQVPDYRNSSAASSEAEMLVE